MRRTKITLGQLEKFLYKPADKLRSLMHASEYKEYIFRLLFLKRLSDVFEEEREQFIETCIIECHSGYKIACL